MEGQYSPVVPPQPIRSTPAPPGPMAISDCTSAAEQAWEHWAGRPGSSPWRNTSFLCQQHLALITSTPTHCLPGWLFMIVTLPCPQELARRHYCEILTQLSGWCSPVTPSGHNLSGFFVPSSRPSLGSQGPGLVPQPWLLGWVSAPPTSVY